MITAQSIAENLERIQERLEQACQRAGRKSQEITLLAVSKTFPVATVEAAKEAGLTCFGENKIQESREKFAALGTSVTWHFIGHLQTNKAKYAVKIFDWIHTIDSLRIVEALAAKATKDINLLVQLNLAQEQQKSGLSPEEARPVFAAIAAAPFLHLQGIMAIPPYCSNPEDSRPHFRAMFTAKETLVKQTGYSLSHLSMGMSHDFEIALEEGADIIRVGSALFGSRPTIKKH